MSHDHLCLRATPPQECWFEPRTIAKFSQDGSFPAQVAIPHHLLFSWHFGYHWWRWLLFAIPATFLLVLLVLCAGSTAGAVDCSTTEDDKVLVDEVAESVPTALFDLCSWALASFHFIRGH